MDAVSSVFNSKLIFVKKYCQSKYEYNRSFT